MKDPRFILGFLVLTVAAGALAQTQPKPAGQAAKPAATQSSTAASAATKLPPGVPPAHGTVRTAFSLRYQEIKIGTGAEALPNKVYWVHYTGWLASNGSKFDSSYDHPPQPVVGKDGKPVMGADGKPQMAAGQPISFAQGFGRVIPGFDQGFGGMKIKGQRRLFIPWQLAYGAAGRPGPDAAHPGIPPKADLIFDIELVDVTDMPAAPPRPPAPPTPPRPFGSMPPQPGSGGAAHPATPAQPGTPTAPATTTAPAQPAAPATPPQPASPATPATPPQPQAK